MKTAATIKLKDRSVPFCFAAGRHTLVIKKIIPDLYPLSFRKKIVIVEDCWIWQGSKGITGYGRIQENKKVWRTHKWTYEKLFGPVQSGYVLDHLCRNRDCVYPLHLEAVTQKENVLRGMGIAASNARKTHCINGHELQGANLKKVESNHRVCRICANESSKKAYIKKNLKG